MMTMLLSSGQLVILLLVRDGIGPTATGGGALLALVVTFLSALVAYNRVHYFSTRLYADVMSLGYPLVQLVFWLAHSMIKVLICARSAPLVKLAALVWLQATALHHSLVQMIPSAFFSGASFAL